MDQPRVLANRYRLEATIGRGGMGVVHRATDQELERAVAVKVLSEGHDEAALERFRIEAKRTAALHHPRIVDVFDVGKDGPDAYLVMELLEGETLAARLAQGPIAAAEAVAIAAQICDALAAAHGAGLVHRDLKPANVFLVRAEDDELWVKLLDFGIAKRIAGATARTDPNAIIGTLDYLSPEQIRGSALDGRADLYALGMTLYRMLTGVLPFTSDNVAALIHQHLSVAPIAPRERAPDRAIPVALDAVVRRLLAKEPSGRPPTARDAKRELLAALEPAAPAPAGPEPAARAEPAEILAGPRHGSERMVDFDQEAAPQSRELDLDLGSHSSSDSRSQTPNATPRGPAIVPVSPLVPLPPPSPLAMAPAAEPLPAWLAPLASVPEQMSKRVAGYSLLALLLYRVFFSGALLPSVVLGLLAALGAVSYWANRRAAR
jgi:serine/threonine-protein kinase